MIKYLNKNVFFSFIIALIVFFILSFKITISEASLISNSNNLIFSNIFNSLGVPNFVLKIISLIIFLILGLYLNLQFYDLKISNNINFLPSIIFFIHILYAYHTNFSIDIAIILFLFVFVYYNIQKIINKKKNTKYFFNLGLIIASLIVININFLILTFFVFVIIKRIETNGFRDYFAFFIGFSIFFYFFIIINYLLFDKIPIEDIKFNLALIDFKSNKFIIISIFLFILEWILFLSLVKYLNKVNRTYVYINSFFFIALIIQIIISFIGTNIDFTLICFLASIFITNYLFLVKKNRIKNIVLFVYLLLLINGIIFLKN